MTTTPKTRNYVVYCHDLQKNTPVQIGQHVPDDQPNTKESALALFVNREDTKHLVVKSLCSVDDMQECIAMMDRVVSLDSEDHSHTVESMIQSGQLVEA